jgi:predicted outer membrane repeat protein
MNLLVALAMPAHAATLTVSTAGPYTTIASAITAASDGDTISVAPGAWAEALDLGGKDLTIRSTGGSTVTFLAPPSGSTAFVATRDEVATLDGFTITPTAARAVTVDGGALTAVDLVIQDAGGLGLTGGALAVDDATLDLSGVTFSGGSATWGGQLHAGRSATVTGTNVVFSGGTATYGGALHVDGGASVSLTNVLVTGAAATRDGGFAYVDGGDLAFTDLSLDGTDAASGGGTGDGGAFYLTGHAALTLTVATISDTRATAGGAVWADDGSVITFDDVVIRDPRATDGGGALDLEDTSATLTTFSVLDGTAAEGGAVRLLGTSAATCEACVYSGNVATGDGGALLLATGSSWEDLDGTWQDNTAANGGSVAMEGSATARFDGTVFDAGQARTSGGAIAHAGTGALALVDISAQLNRAILGDGGAVWSTAPVTLEGGTFDGNDATLGNGGAIAGEGALDLDGTRFTDNTADDDGGAIFASGDALTVREATFFRNTAGGDGGGVYADSVADVDLSRAYLHGNAGANGGAIRLRSPGAAALTNLRVTDNLATDGAGLYTSGPAQVAVTNCTFAGNDAADEGGHLYAGGPVRLVNDLFTQALDGGGVWGATATGSDRFYNLTYLDSGGGWVGGWSDATGTSGNLAVEPQLVSYTADGDERDDDLSLAATSPAVDAGSPALFDVDATRSDIGAYGGTDADVLDGDGDGWFDNVDCDDGDASVYPGAPETAYDAIDQDCDGADLDDVDGDGYGSVYGGDCDDTDPTIFPGAAETWYDGIDADCSGDSDYDRDGDSHDATFGGGDDCDDDDPTVYGTRPETWYDGVDSDCDGRSDYDRDRDGHDASFYGGDDCDDLSAARFPGNTEIPYDSVDQDCSGADLVDVDGDGWVGEGAGGTDCNDGDPGAYPGAEEDPDDGQDTDCDGYSEWDRDGDGYLNELGAGDDCDDDDAAINPGAREVWYDGVDDDCDGRDDDQDGDGWEIAQDCDDLDPAVNPDAAERENGLDDDCDGWAESDDRDRDGLADLLEWNLGTDYEDADTDDDTLSDGDELTDHDGDQILDALDTDDDGDGIPTRDELTVDLGAENGEGDGVYDTDVDGDGVLNAHDPDSDGDGYLDRDEGTADLDNDGLPDFLDYQGGLVGGGCGGGWAGLLFAGAFFGSLRRNRRAAALAAAPAALLAAGPAFAIDAHGFVLGATTGDPLCYTRLGCPEVDRKGSWDAGVTVDYADDPLAEQLPDGRVPVLSALATANVAAAYSFGGLQVDLVAPVHLFGQDSSGGFTTLGDVRVGAQVPIRLKVGPALGVRTAIWAPTGAEAHWVGSLGPRAMVALSGTKEFGKIGVVALAGAMAAFPEKSRNLSSGLGPVAGLGVAYRATDAISASFELSTASDLPQVPLEASLGARARLPMGAWASLGAAAGIGEGVGASRWRAYVGIGFSRVTPEPAPPPPPVDPTADRDGDGFPDALDKCPDQAETLDGFTDDDGCPELDGDGDGVAFEKDVCPREPIRPEQDPRWSDGCPKVAEFAGDRIVITETVHFKEDQAELLPSSARVLTAVSEIMRAHTDLPWFLIEGHANTNGPDAYNLRLSDARAFSVMRFLVEHGVPYDRLLSKGYGETRPLAPGDDDGALALNRRVEFRVVRVEDIPADARQITLPTEIIK